MRPFEFVGAKVLHQLSFEPTVNNHGGNLARILNRGSSWEELGPKELLRGFDRLAFAIVEFHATLEIVEISSWHRNEHPSIAVLKKLW